MSTAPIQEPISALGTKIVKLTAKEQVCEKLVHMICSGLLRVGDELPSERELARTLGVSRETVRGAMQTLAGRGLIRISQGARTRVVRTDGLAPAEAEATLGLLEKYSPASVYEARQIVEGVVMYKAALRITQETLDRLADLLSVQATLFDDPPSFQISDSEFHALIFESCRNPLLANFLGYLYAYALDVRRTVLSRPEAVKRSYEDHVKILAALGAGDPDAAVAANSTHLGHVYKSLLEEGADPAP